MVGVLKTLWCSNSLCSETVFLSYRITRAETGAFEPCFKGIWASDFPYVLSGQTVMPQTATYNSPVFGVVADFRVPILNSIFVGLKPWALGVLAPKFLPFQ